MSKKSRRIGCASNLEVTRRDHATYPSTFLIYLYFFQVHIDSRNLFYISHDYLHFAGPRLGQLVADGDRARNHVDLRRPRQQPRAAQGRHRSALARI